MPPAGLIIRKKSVLLPLDRLIHTLLILVSLTFNYIFWMWWVKPENIGFPPFFWLITLATFYLSTYLPAMFLIYTHNMKRPIPIPAQNNLKVALITLTVPGSESLEIVEKQLIAMTQVSYPHENWLLVDKIHDPILRALAQQYGVHYFSRHDVKRWGLEKVTHWNQIEPPFKAKTKAGNVNAWLEAYGYKNYNYFVQFDIDHTPKPNYLDETLGYFQDPQVAWVQSPSVYKNLEFWTARGAAEQELIFQGPLQMGFFGFSETPFIIGSHCTYRMEAIAEIGGFQPTRAEDHLDTVCLALEGYHGVYVPKVLAEGDGPETFETYLGQQFAWAFSIVQVWLRYTPRMIRHMNWQQMLQFLFAQTWYPFSSISMFLMFSIPVVALTLDKPISNVNFIDFLGHYLPLSACSLIAWYWSSQWFKPQGIGLSWRGCVLHIARWPVVLSACIQAILNVDKPYMITPKGIDLGESRSFHIRTYSPFFLLVGISLASSQYFLSIHDHGETQGYLLFVLQGAILVFSIFPIALICDLRRLTQEGVSLMRSLFLRSGAIATAILIASLLGSTAVSSSPLIWEAVTNDSSTQINSRLGNYLSRLSPSVNTAEAAEVKTINSPSETNESRFSPQGEELPTNRILFGVYDPDNIFRNTNLDIQNYFVPWNLDDKVTIALRESQARGRIPLITLEPWDSLTGNRNTLLEDTISGKNDRWIRNDAQAIKNSGAQTVLVRWGHEMDLYQQYPWSVWYENADLYIAAYTHVRKVFEREGVRNVKWVWSPAGEPHAYFFYPGADLVDYVGVTCLGFEAHDLANGHPTARTFTDLFGERYRFANQFGKPIIISELGVSGSREHKTHWLAEAYNAFGSFPALSMVVYFNHINAEINNVHNEWKDRPDWRIDPELFPPK